MTRSTDSTPGGTGPRSFGVIVGAMKAGTTSLFHYLGAHPEVAPARRKEPNFFVQDQPPSSGLEGYRSLWDWDPTRHTLALEASVGYSKYPHFPNAAERIADFSQRYGVRFRFLYLMRDPVERYISQYMHGRANGWTTGTLDDWIYGDAHLHTCLYAAQLDEYARRFSDRDILPLMFEDLRDDRAGTVARALKFLGLDPAEDAPPLGPVHNPTASKRLMPVWLLRARRVGVAKVYRTLVPTPARLAARRLLTRSGSSRFELTPTQRAHLVDRLAPDLHRLDEVYGIDIRRWESARQVWGSGNGDRPG